MSPLPTRPASRILLAALAITAVALVTGPRGGGPARGAAEAATSAPPPVASDPVADAVQGVLRVSVTIEGDSIYGAGVLVDPPRGLILTSLHVVDDMRTPRATTFDGRSSVVQVLARDRRLDLALLYAPALRMPGLPPPRLGDASRLRAGEEVYAIGMPRKLPFTVSRGIVSYVNRHMDEADYLQVDMSINDGNSGGPVFTRTGEVVGIMSFILRRTQGLSFALPVSYATAAFPQLRPPPAAHAQAASAGTAAAK